MPTSVDTNVVVLPDGTALSEGVDIAVVSQGGPPAGTQRVRWLRTSDGALIADIYGADVGGARPKDILQLTSYGADATREAYVGITATNSDGSDQVGFDINCRNPSEGLAFSSITAKGGNGLVQVLDGNGASGFPQLANIQALSAVGPTPVAWNVTVKSPTVIIAIQMSGWNTVTGKPGGNPIFFGGSQVGGFDFWWNVANQHLVLPMQIIKLTNQTPGVKVLSVNSSGTTQTNDNNDQFHALVLN